MQATVQTPAAMPAAFARGLESGDIEQLACLYVEEAATRTSEGQVVHGIAGIREVLQGLLARNARFDGTVRWSVTVGDVALIIVDWTAARNRTEWQARALHRDLDARAWPRRRRGLAVPYHESEWNGWDGRA